MMQLDKAYAGSGQVFNNMILGAEVVALGRHHLHKQNAIGDTQSHSDYQVETSIEQTDVVRRPRRSVLAVVGRVGHDC
jgi:hypothetical protein